MLNSKHEWTRSWTPRLTVEKRGESKEDWEKKKFTLEKHIRELKKILEDTRSQKCRNRWENEPEQKKPDCTTSQPAKRNKITPEDPKTPPETPEETPTPPETPSPARAPGYTPAIPRSPQSHNETCQNQEA